MSANLTKIFFVSVGALFFLHQPAKAVLVKEESDPLTVELFGLRHRQANHYGERPYKNSEGPSKIYNVQGLNYPKVPLFHPYQPMDNERIDAGMMAIPLTMHLPVRAEAGLPYIIANEINANSIDRSDSLKIFLVAQNFPWKKGTEPCFRPQYATDGPWAPSRGTYYAIRAIRTGLFYSDTQQVCFKGSQTNEFVHGSVSIHPEGCGDPKNVVEGDLILSEDNFHICGLDPDVGQSFWSAVFYNDSVKNRAIVTLHWLLSDEQLDTLPGLLRGAPMSTYSEVENLFRVVGDSPAFKGKGGHVIKMHSIWDALREK